MCVQSVAIVEIIMDAWLDVEAEIGGECIFGTDGGQCGEQQALVADAFRHIVLKSVASPIMYEDPGGEFVESPRTPA